ncbi:ABC transporter permease [Parasporobacterium paucivorans]|uniref:Molybdate transport system permease protein n=1 Tax=Parasporobacterium paucivorans DSM 15970 TaxID=1122934 RepID=A0A1M6I5F9_9FIRM|nr:ABC transporter permease subunit [Parasporobacterium paucivorans]SHJ29662.1 molybdate transport system permease protein [Parasporobacterium paucivorans DSM 15970]
MKDYFKIISYVITVVVTLFIGLSILAIIVKGFPDLREAFLNRETQFAVRLSLYTSSISTVICLLLSIPVAYTMTRTNFIFKKISRTVIGLPMALPYLVLGLCLLIVFSSPMGKLLRDAGFQVVFHPNGIIMAHLIVNLPFCINMIITAFTQVNKRLEFIAGTLGASGFRQFITVTLPLSKNAILSATMLTWSRALGEFGATLMLVGCTRLKTETLPTNIYLNISTGNNDMAMASAVILLMISVLLHGVTYFFNRKSTIHNRMEDS